MRAHLAACAGVAAVLALLLTAPPDASAETVMFTPTDDALVEASFPRANFGAERRLLVDAEPSARRSYLRFDLSGISRRVERAALRVFAYDGSQDGPEVYSADTGWSESEITWETRPARTGEPLDDAGAVAEEGWSTFDVTAAVSDAGVHAFALVPTSGDGADFYSSEGVGDGTPSPELVVTVADDPPTVALTNPAPGASYTKAGAVEVRASASDDVGVTRVEFYDGNVLRETDTSEPFSYGWSVSSAENGSHRWTARAYDTGGASALSAPVDVTVAIEPPALPPLPLPLPPEGGDVYFTGDFETGNLSQWPQLSCDPDRHPTLALGPALDGYAARFELRPGDENGTDGTSRCEVATKHSDPHRIYQGEEWWFGFAIRIEQADPQGLWRTFVQWKKACCNPVLGLYDRYGNGNFQLRHHDFGATQNYWTIARTLNVWHRFVVRIYFHSDPSQGYFQLWYAEGDAPLAPQLLTNPDGSRTYRAYASTHGGTAEGEHSHWRVGLYRSESHTVTDVMYADKARYGTSFDAVAP